MKKKNLILGITLFIFGTIGIISLLTMEISLPPETEVFQKDKFSAEQIKFLTLINPTIMLIVAVIVGTLLHNKVNLRVQLIENIINKNNTNVNYSILRYGIIGGVLAGVLLSLVGLIYYPHLPEEFLRLGDKLKPTIAVRFLYGGLTEEILMRFGLMTFIVWMFSKVLGETKPIVYWIGILIAAIIFAVAHFPIAYNAVGRPSFSLLTYITIANSIGGIIFGWLYWKKGLESAFIAHIFAHIIMVIADSIIT